MALRLSTSAAALLALSSPAWADVTAQEVYDSWKTQMDAASPEMSLSVGSETAHSNGLTLRDVKFLFETDGVAGSVTLDEMSLTERGDGTVAITNSSIWPMVLDVDGSVTESEDLHIEAALVQSDVPTIASGAPGDISYAVDGADLQLVLQEFLVDDVPLPAAFDLTMTDVDSLYRIQGGDLVQTETALSAATMAVTLDVTDPETNGNIKLNAEVAGLDTQTSMQAAQGVSLFAPDAMASDGFAYSSTGTSDGFVMTLEMRESGSETNLAFSAARTNNSSDVSEATMSAKAEYDAVNMQVFSSDLPIPATFSAKDMDMRFGMPLGKSEEAQPFGLGLNFVDLEISDFLWNLFDPASVLPREPATLRFDLDGTGNWFFNLLDPQEAAKMEDAARPGELHALGLKNLLLSVAGAQLSGEGDFTFDNSDLTTFDGLPLPTGALSLELLGGNDLLGKLVQMGLLPQEQAFGAQMMLGMFAEQAEGQDKLTSTIEIKNQGQIFANGQQLR